MTDHQLSRENRSSEFRPFIASPVPHLFRPVSHLEALSAGASPEESAFCGRKASLILLVLLAAWLVFAAMMIGSLPIEPAAAGSPAASVERRFPVQGLQSNAIAVVASAFGPWYACRGEACGVEACRKPVLCEIPMVTEKPMARKIIKLRRSIALPGLCPEISLLRTDCKWFGLEVV